MAWLGVNLNESLTSIKGQISSFTREVLAEDGVNDHGEDIVIPKMHVKELESAVYFHKQEVEELKKRNREVEDMLRGAELSASRRISDLKQQLSDSQKEVQLLKEKSSEWHWENRSQIEPPLEESADHKDQILSLEKLLKENTRKHEDEIIALQESHKAEINRLEKEFVGRESAISEENEDSTACNEQNHKECEAKTLALQAQLASMTNSYDEVCAERNQLNLSLVELDNEHQQVIDQVLKSKLKVAEELSITKKSLTNVHNDLAKNSELLSISQSKVSELLKLKKDMTSQVTLVQQKYEDANEEKVKLISEIKRKENVVASDSSNEKIQLNAIIRRLKEDQQSRDNTVVNLQSELGNYQSLVSQQSSQNDLLESAVDNLRKNLEDKKRENETYQRKIEESNKITGELNEKVKFLEVEVLKYEAVLEEKNDEFVSAYDRLQRLEKLNENILREFDTERREFLKKLKDAEDKNKHLEEQNKICEETVDDSSLTLIIQDLLKTCNVETRNELPSAVSELSSEVALLRCERDKLTEDLASVTQELKDNQELLETQEMEKNDIERECEDLRDQIEELQCGERQNPEGSVTPRSLPTIEEEEDSSTNLPESLGNKTENERKSIIGFGSVEDCDKVELLERIEQLSTQVAALTEARQNLELELSSLRTDKSSLEQSLIRAKGQLGNLANLEVEASSLRTKNESLIDQLNVTNIQLQSCSHIEDEKNNLELQVRKMTNAMEKLNVDSSKSNLSKESDVWLSSDPESQLSLLQNELDKVKGLLIYKDDQIDQWKQSIEQIGKLFGVEFKDLRQVFIGIRQEYDTLKSKVHTASTNDLEKSKESSEEGESDSEVNLAGLISSSGETQVTESKLNIDQINNLNEQLNKKASENTLLLKDLNIEQNKCIQLAKALVETNASKQATLNEVLEKTKEIDNLRLNESEFELKLEECIKEKVDAVKKLKKIQDEFERRRLKSEENTYKFLTTNEDRIRIDEECKQLQYDYTVAKVEIEELMETNKKIEAEKIMLEKKIGLCEENESKKADYESISKQLSVLQQERQQLITMSTQKHQESVSYYNEIQRLSQLIQSEKQNAVALEESLISQLNAKDREILRLQDEVKMLKSKSVELQNQIGRVKDIEQLQSSSKNEVKLLQEELRNINDELLKQKELCKGTFSEREQLRIVNANISSQLENKRKEFTELQEKEKHISQECLRLKQHLMEVEETYTQEAVQSELRENSLRQSIAKLHEKMSSHSNLYSTTKEKSTAQMEELRETLQDAVNQRDEAVQKLLIAEESSLQHQEGLSRLQQVLQDFQKAQIRDIALATEREKRRYEEERDKNVEMEIEMRKLQEKLNETEATMRTTKTMREELQTKEDTLIALKSQVQAVQSAAKKSHEQVALLQNSSEGKVDKHLLRNLIVGYFATNSDKRPEVLRVVAQVLDFSAEERARTGIDLHPGSWLSSLANFLAPPPSNIRIASKVDVLDHTSLSQAFIRFLEEESLPRQIPRLPAVEMAEEAQQKAQKKISARANYNTNPLFKNTEIEGSNNSASPFRASSMPSSLSALQPVTTISKSGKSSSDKDASAPPISQSQSLPANPLLIPSISSSVASTSSPVSHDTYFTVDEVGLSEPKFLSKLLNSDGNSVGQSKT